MRKKKIESKPIEREIDIPSTNEIIGYAHCGLCLGEMPEGISPREYSSIEVGYTPQGWQAWCKRHDVNIVHIHFEGQKHPANTARQLLPGEERPS